ncbi:MAG: 1-acyl-sn-glycerol-3-phosphate acyltransferase, partial [Gammaproteobacteria bacterium]|nr:1-acyl-sn-glycerol-3-phosphate acyltransferase [Gammaproteobacteria bacterium]
MRPAQHLKALAAFAAVSLNLLFWCAPLLVVLAVRLLAPKARPTAHRMGCAIYRWAVAFDDWWLKRVSGARWRCPRLDLDPESPCILIANHQSWADIFVLQSAVARRGPVIKFLCKRELAYIPVLGLIMLAFDFPIMRRRGRVDGSVEDRRRGDRERVRQACAVLFEAPAAMLTFAEGTRFGEAKRRRSVSPHRHLLRPRAGGFTAIVEALAPLEPPVVDVTIHYGRS